MSNSLTRRLGTAAVAVILATAGQPVSTALAASASRLPTSTTATAKYLAAHPGGTQINAREISYNDGALIVTVSRDVGTLAAPDCPSGFFCFYDGVNYTYPRGKLSGCGWQDLGTWGWRNRVASVDYDMREGTVGFLNEAGSSDTLLFSVGTSRRSIPDVYPNRDKADYVSRTNC